MKQVMQSSSGETVVRDVPAPTNPRHNVLVRNEYSIVSSGTERARVQTAQKSLITRVAERPELALKVVRRARQDGIRRTRELIRENLSGEGVSGYSCAGTVVEVGAVVRGISVGDRVACGGAGQANHAEIVTIPGNLCCKVPEGVPMMAAALTTIGSIALHGLRLADVALGERVAIIGCGLVGQIACRLASATGAHVLALDIDAERVAAAGAAGADAAIAIGEETAHEVMRLTEGLGMDAVVVTAAASTSAPLMLATEVARDRARVVLVGDVPLDVPRHAFYEKELSFRVSRSYGPGRYDPEYEQRGLDYPIGYVRWTERRNMECILDLQRRGKIRLEDLVSDVMPVHDAAGAYQWLSGPQETRPRGAIAFAYAAAKPAAEAVVPPRPIAPLTPGRPVRIGLLGPGSFALSVLMPAFRRAGAELVAVAGGSGVRAEAATREAGFLRAEGSVEALLAAEDLDAVVIGTRHGSHASLVQAALAAGKHVFCEKPVALDRQQLDSVLAGARSSERVLAVGLNRRFAPHVRQARRFVAAAAGPTTAVYRVSAGAVPSSSWVHDLAEGGGRIIGECCHFFDTLAFLIDAEITSVYASGIPDRERATQSMDNALITLTFADGSVGTVAYVASGASALAKERVELFRGARTAVIDDFRTLLLYDGQDQTKDGKKGQDKGHQAEAHAFLDAIRSGEEPIPLERIRNVHLACFAAVESLCTGTIVEPSAATAGASLVRG